MSLQLGTDIQYLKGVGPKLGEILRHRGVSTVGDLLEWYPRGYEDRRAMRNIASLEAGQVVSLEATVQAVRSIPMGKSHRRIYEIVIADSSGRIACKYFRVPYKGYFERFSTQQKIRVAGKVILYRGRLEFHHPDLQVVYEDDPKVADQLIPLYTDTEGLSPAKLRKLLQTAIDELIDGSSTPGSTSGIVEILPVWLREKYKLLSRAQALKQIHQPLIAEGADFLQYRAPAQRRIIFEEFFWMELHMTRRRLGMQREEAPAMRPATEIIERFNEVLPFRLTGAQLRVFKEIEHDLSAAHPMHRLVQGDVGSGKTLVALLSSLVAKENGYQSAMMVPTEILAEQHFKTSERFLSPLGIRAARLTGSLKEREHSKIRERLIAGDIDLLIGTHALIENDVLFKNLGLVIIDEQHRFGVEQRMRLKKNQSPHFLVMTATPIPRTLAMTVYGDLDVSIIDEMPPGRSPVITRKVFSSKRDLVFDFMRQQVQKGRQAYVIYPLVEESEKIDLKNAVSECEALRAHFPDFRIGLLHGKMKAEEKDAVMNLFRTGEIQVLVSTTVIEVGVDVPNANLIVIEHAERFGLSQLHQLRGRVGRGEHKSYCVLILGYAVSEEAIHRTEVIVGTTDGFKIAEADLEIRGPGEFLGRRQSGLPGFRMANLFRDISLLQEARAAARDILEHDPELREPHHQFIRSTLDIHSKAIVG